MAYEETSALCDLSKNYKGYQRNTRIQAIFPRFSLYTKFHLHHLIRLTLRIFIQHLAGYVGYATLIIYTCLSVADSPQPTLNVSDDDCRNKPPMVAKRITQITDIIIPVQLLSITSTCGTTAAATPAPTSDQKGSTEALHAALISARENYVNRYSYD